MKCLSLLAFLLISLVSPLRAQPNDGGDSDFDELSFGFMFQYFNTDFKIFRQPDWRKPYPDPVTGTPLTGKVNAIRARHRPGFGLGFVSNLRMGNHADLRFTPGLSFTDKEVLYFYDTGAPVSKVVQSTMVDLPLGVKIKSDQRDNFRVYLLAGMKYSVNIVSKKKTDDSSNPPLDKLLKMNDRALSYEAGIGLDLYFPYFKMSPELKFSQSVNNIMKRGNDPYSYPIDKLFLHSLQFSLFFQ
jgi:hypothetical protein